MCLLTAQVLFYFLSSNLRIIPVLIGEYMSTEDICIGYMYVFNKCILNMMAFMEDPEGSNSGSLPVSPTLSPVLFSSVFLFKI